MYPFTKQSASTDSLLALMGAQRAAVYSSPGCALLKCREHQSHHCLVPPRSAYQAFLAEKTLPSLLGNVLILGQQTAEAEVPASPESFWVQPPWIPPFSSEKGLKTHQRL